MQHLPLFIILSFCLQLGSCRCNRIEPVKISLIAAVKQSNVQNVKACLAQGTNPNQPDAYGTFPLHWAAYCKQPNDPKSNIVRLLIDKGAAIDAKDKDGWTPFDWADHSDNKNITSVNHLINKAIDLKNIADLSHNRKNLLHYAARLGGEESKKIVPRLRSLFNLHTLVNQKDSYGCTPLHYAAENATIDIAFVKMLLERGACTDVKNKDHSIPLDCVVSKRKDVVLELLLHTKH